MKATLADVRGALEILAESFPHSKPTPKGIVILANRLAGENMTDRELRSWVDRAQEELEHFPSPSKALGILKVLRKSAASHDEMHRGYDRALELRYIAMFEAETSHARRRALSERWDALCAARWRKRVPGRFSEKQSEELDNTLAELGLDHEGRCFYGGDPLVGAPATQVERWEP